MSDDRIVLSSGYAPTEAFPGEQLAEVAADILRNRAARALQYSAREGEPELRRLVASWLTDDGVSADPDEILIVTGAKQNLDITARAYCRPGDLILMGSPSYMNGIKILERTGARVVPVRSDDDGIDLDDLESTIRTRSAAGDKVALVYDIPDFHNPTGRVLTPDRRRRLVQLAVQYGFRILEDNPYRWTRLSGSPVPPLKAFDEEGVVISTGTFAKILGPGLRLGWVHADRDAIARVAPFKAEGGTSPLCQWIAHDFFAPEGALERHLVRIRSILRSKRDVMADAITLHLGDRVAVRVPEGSYYMWLDFGADVDTDVLATEAAQLGVVVYRGSVFFPGSDPLRQHLRLSYSYESADRIVQGIVRLRAALDEHRGSSSSSRTAGAAAGGG